MLIGPPASFSGVRSDSQPVSMLGCSWPGEKPLIHRVPEWEGVFIYPLPLQRGTWRRVGSWEGRMDCVCWGWAWKDPGFVEEALPWFSMCSLEGDGHVPGRSPRWK